jgi:hypothetical protein
MFLLKSSVFWYITPCSPLKVTRRFEGTCRLHLQVLLAAFFMLVYCLAYSSTLKVQATCSSE